VRASAASAPSESRGNVCDGRAVHLGEDVKADLAADGVGEAQVRKLLAQHAHHLLPAAPDQAY